MEIRDKNGELLISVEDRDFDSAELQRGVFCDLELEGGNFEDARLNYADFTRTDLYWARFFRADCSHAIFRGASLLGACLVEVNLRFADLRDADFSRDNLNGTTNLCKADLRGADLSTAILTDAEMQDAMYDSQTKFPQNFDPIARGMIYNED